MTYLRTDIKYDDGQHIHACEGNRMAAHDPDTFVVWTKCGKDVPANKGFTSYEMANCPNCATSEAGAANMTGDSASPDTNAGANRVRAQEGGE